MNTINRRYLLLGEPETIQKGISTVLAKDRVSGSEVDLFLVEGDSVPKQVLEYMESVYLKMENVHISEMVRILNFRLVEYTDGKEYHGKTYLLVLEHEARELLFFSAEGAEYSEILGWMISFLQILNHLLLKGVLWSYFDLRNIFLCKGEDGTRKLLLRNPISAAIMTDFERFSGYSSVSSGDYDVKNFDFSLYALGRFFMTWIRRGEKVEDFAAELSFFKERIQSEEWKERKEVQIIAYILESLLNDNYIKRPFIFSSIIEDVNQQFGTDFPRILVDDMQNMSLSEERIVQEKYYREMESSYRQILGREIFGKLLLVHVKFEEREQFVDDLIRRVSFWDLPLICYRQTGEDNYTKGWLKRFRNFRYSSSFVEEFGGKELFLEKYEELLNHPEIFSDEMPKDNETLKLLTVAAKTLLDNPSKEFMLYLFTDFEKMNPCIVATLYYALHFSERNRWFIITFSDLEDQREGYLRELQDALVSEGKAEKLTVQFLMMGELKKILQELCFRQDIPQDFINLLFQQTDGRPKLLFDLLEECVRDEVLFFDESTRNVQFCENYQEYFTRRIKLVSDYRNSRYSELPEEVKGLAKLMSVLFLPHEAEFYRNMLNADKQRITEALSELEKNRLLDVEIRGGKKLFELTRRDPQLHQFIYGQLSIWEKKFLHQRAMAMIHPKSDQEHYAIARHFYAIGDEESLEKGASILMDLGKKYADAMDYEKSIDFYERSLQGKMDDETRFRVYFLLFLYSVNIGDNDLISGFAEQLELLSEKQLNTDLLAEYYGRYALVFYGMVEADEIRQKHCSSKLEELFQKTPTRTVSVYYYGLLARREREAKNYEKSSEYYRKSLELSEDLPEFYSHCSFCYRQLGLNAFFEKDWEKCIALSKTAIRYAVMAKDVRGETAAVNNIAVTYMEYDVGHEQVEKYYKENLRLSRRYGIAHIEVISLINLAYLANEENKLRLGYEYVKAAFVRSEKTREQEKKITVFTLLIHYARRMNDLSIACEYFHEGEKLAMETAFLDEHFDFYEEAQRLFFELRNFETVRRISERNLAEFPNMHMSDSAATELYHIICDILIDGEAREEELISFLETSMPVNEPDKRELMQQLYRILFLFHSCGLREKYASFIEKVVEVDGLNLETYALQIFFKHPDPQELTEEELNSLVEHVSRDERNNESIQIRLYLAEHYMQSSQPWEAAAMIFEAAQNTVDFLRNIPFSDRKKVFELNYYARVFGYLEHFKEHRTFLLPIEKPERTTSYDDLERYLYRTDLDELATEFEVSENLNRERHLFHLRLEQAIAEFGDDFEVNLKIILEVVAKRMMATEVYLCTLQGDIYHPELLLLNAGEEKFSDLSRMLDLSRLNIVQNLSVPNCRWKAVMTSPIFSPEQDVSVEGVDAPVVLILASTGTVHRLNRKGYDWLKGYMLALSLLVENYQLSRIASTDRLTGTLTRRALDEEMRYRFMEARRGNYPLSVLMCDLDHFKKVNDTYGHRTGDLVLKEVAKVSLELLSGSVKVGRYGGEEFLAILPRTNSEEAVKIGEQLRKRVEEHVYQDLPDFHTTVSVGIASLRSNQDTMVSLQERADEALYKAKSDGRNRVVVWTPGMEVKKTETELAKGMVTGNVTRDALNQLAFLELLRDSSVEMSESDAVFNILSRLLDVLEAYEVVVVSTRSKMREGFSLRRGDIRLYDASMADSRILDEIIGKPGGFYRIAWEERSMSGESASLNSWDSVLGLEIVSQGETCALMYLRVSLREKEFGKNDLNLATIFSTFLTEYL